ncbi:MAG: hypothetical protein IT376_13025 [Polyangiaceae bacterium]|nr:hypothetical protein [Polyangiaceae bacterium]
MRRRDALSMLAAGWVGAPPPAAAAADARDASGAARLEALDVELPRDESVAGFVRGRAATAPLARLLVPGALPAARAPVLVLLHGLGETHDRRLALRAWSELYGLARAHARLATPPVTRTEPRRRWLDDERLARINRRLAHRPFRGVVLACPVTPNPWRAPTERLLDAYSAWLVDALLPAVRERVPATRGGPVGLDGCSMGGFVAPEVWLRRAHAFSTLGVVQAALHAPGAARLAERIAATVDRSGPVGLHVETSSDDPYRVGNEELARQLHARGLPCRLTVPAGPHDQPWLREVGSIELLLWHEGQLHGRRG